MNAEIIFQALTPFVSPVVVAVVKSLTEKVPDKWLPAVCGMVGVLIDTVSAISLGTDLNPIRGAALGFAGVGLRELQDQLRKPKPPVS